MQINYTNSQNGLTRCEWDFITLIIVAICRATRGSVEGERTPWIARQHILCIVKMALLWSFH